MAVYRQNPPPERDEHGFEVKREFVVQKRTGFAVNPDWYEVRCYRNGQHSGATPYPYDQARACVVRLLGDGWAAKPNDHETLDFLSKLPFDSR